jgi:alpha-beta hydrolase superfamily lysophospholipase
MADHSGRYDRLARRLCGAGFAVWAADMRGFGNTADPVINDPGRGGLLGHCADFGALPAREDDLRNLNRRIRELHPGKKLFMLGHSWGSFLTQSYIEEHSADIDGCILSGTRGPGGFKVRAGAALFALAAFFMGPRRPSLFCRSISEGAFNRPFRPNRTPFDWISRDDAEVDAYNADPNCGKLCSVGFYRDMTALLVLIHRKNRMAGIRTDLPVYLYAGNADPVGDMGTGPTALVTAYREMGIGDMEFALYPGARHELHSETNREEMAVNLVEWLNRHIETG